MRIRNVHSLAVLCDLLVRLCIILLNQMANKWALSEWWRFIMPDFSHDWLWICHSFMPSWWNDIKSTQLIALSWYLKSFCPFDFVLDIFTSLDWIGQLNWMNEQRQKQQTNSKRKSNWKETGKKTIVLLWLHMRVCYIIYFLFFVFFFCYDNFQRRHIATLRFSIILY